MTISKGINNANLKSGNRGLVLKMIATGEARTRIELAKKCGLSKMSLTNIINEFIKAHIVKETEIEKVKGAGRNPVVLTITDRCKKVIGVAIDRTAVTCMLTDISNNVLVKTSYSINEENAKNLMEIVYAAIEEVSKDYDTKDILGIGVSTIGPVNVQTGVILNPPNFYGVTNVEIVKLLTAKYGLPVYIDNIYSAAALIEKYFGVGKHYRDFVFLGIGNGVGSGIVVNDEVLHSAAGNTPELGHMSIDYNGKSCSCGNRGCLELYTAVDKVRIKLMFATGKDLSFEEFSKVAGASQKLLEEPENEECKEIVKDFSKEQIDDINMIFEDANSAIAAAGTSVVNLLHTNAIVIGHKGVNIPSKYLRSIEDSINEKRAFKNENDTMVIKSAFGEETHILGAATLVIDAAFKGEISL